MAKMESLQIEVPVTPTVTDTVQVTLETAPVQPASTAEVKAIHPANRNPSEWRIEPITEDTIKAINNTSRDVFEGSMEDFNKILRG